VCEAQETSISSVSGSPFGVLKLASAFKCISKLQAEIPALPVPYSLLPAPYSLFPIPFFPHTGTSIFLALRYVQKEVYYCRYWISIILFFRMFEVEDI